MALFTTAPVLLAGNNLVGGGIGLAFLVLVLISLLRGYLLAKEGGERGANAFALTMILVRMAIPVGFAVLATLFQANFSRFYDENLRLLYEVHDNLVKVKDEESAKKFMNKEGKGLMERYKNWENRKDEFLRDADKEEMRLLREEQEGKLLQSESEAVVKGLKKQVARIEALAAQSPSLQALAKEWGAEKFKPFHVAPEKKK